MEPTRIHKRLKRKLAKNRKGGIEGLPLQLMIIIIIATIGLSVIMGWMNSIEPPKTIGDVCVDSGDIELRASGYGQSTAYRSVNEKIQISVFDNEGNPLEGATVVLTGLGITAGNGGTVHGTTGTNGSVSFYGVKVKMTGSVGFINVEVSKAGYGEDTSCRITVVA